MGIPVISVCAILAIVPLLWLPELPARHIVWIMIAGGIVLAIQRKVELRFVGIGLLFASGVFLLRKKAYGRCSI